MSTAVHACCNFRAHVCLPVWVVAVDICGSLQKGGLTNSELTYPEMENPVIQAAEQLI